MTREISDEELRIAQRLGEIRQRLGEIDRRAHSPCLYERWLDDGRVLHLLPWRAAGLQLSVGRGDGYYTDSWIYDAEQPGADQIDAGWRAALGWDGEGEPEGWYRHPQSGRRRPDGDPAKEFVRP